MKILLAFLVVSLRASAQHAESDSNRYDIGYLTLNKSFTQHVTIRGEDLEKMPFSNLTEAIRAWLFGAYTGPASISFVVDGNPVADVNSYPIFDIESVTWIDNAVGTAAYGNTQRELVLVTTRRGKGKEGLRIAAQAGLVNHDSNGDPTNTGVVHQYYAGVYKNMDKVSFGVSADWQRDVMPQLKNADFQTQIPLNLQRWRFNGWLDWRPDAQNTVSFRMGYAPQKAAQSFVEPNYGPYSGSSDIRSHYTAPQLSWEGRWLPGLRNRLDAEYLHSGQSAYVSTTQVFNNGGLMVANVYKQSIMINHVVLRDHLSYAARAGEWQIVPALDISYHHIDEKNSYVQYQTDSSAIQSADSGREKGSLFYVTPAVDLTLARALDINAGLQVNASSLVDTSKRRFFPFVTASVDLLHLGEETGAAGLKIYGSYAVRPNRYIDDYTLPDFSGGGGSQTLYNVYYGKSGYEIAGGFPVAQTFYGPQPSCWTWQAGVEYVPANGRVTVQYSYERRSYSLVAVEDSLMSGYEPWTASFHHADVRFKVVDGRKVKWLTGFNINLLKSKAGTMSPPQYVLGFVGTTMGDTYPAKYSWTGGWVNRLTVGGFTAGLDVLYHMGLSGLTTGLPKNTAAVPNLYAGYRFGLPRARQLELFVESRGLVMNTHNDFIDGRRFYTIGGSVSL
ncbi:MAG TPA: hypothetical protein VGS79_23880 [Puia sp.]|nr:hypothetical protein [Puia sp.]